MPLGRGCEMLTAITLRMQFAVVQVLWNLFGSDYDRRELRLRFPIHRSPSSPCDIRKRSETSQQFRCLA